MCIDYRFRKSKKQEKELEHEEDKKKKGKEGAVFRERKGIFSEHGRKNEEEGRKRRKIIVYKSREREGEEKLGEGEMSFLSPSSFILPFSPFIYSFLSSLFHSWFYFHLF